MFGFVYRSNFIKQFLGDETLSPSFCKCTIVIIIIFNGSRFVRQFALITDLMAYINAAEFSKN
uniref:Uncharacterized protein n=1 Tax=Anguilla anguilla TaxID=7936 RepID=A0A0E9SKD2_ANGAN